MLVKGAKKNSIFLTMRFKLFVVFVLLALLACSDDNSNPTYPFTRTVLDVSIVKRCKDGSFTPGANCYLIRWQHPYEKTDLQGYYIWIDTAVVKDSVQKISQSQIDSVDAFVTYNSKSESDTLDLTDLISEFIEKRDSLHIAIWAKYSGGDQGAVQHLHIYFGDDVSPLMVSFNDSASSNAIWIDWIRPTDQRDFYFPDVMDGPIAGYNVNIRAENTTEDIRNSMVYIIAGNNDLRYFERFNKDGRSVKLESIARNDPRFLRLAIIDGKGFVNDNLSANNWKIEITGLKPERSYRIGIIAFDSAGNESFEENRLIKTTDDIPPLIASKFRLYSDSGDGLPRLDSNRLILFWPRSLDPLSNQTQIQLDSTLRIPANYSPGLHYREVMSYSIEQLNGKAWEAIPRVSAVRDGYYNARYRPENDSMKSNPSGEFVSDTLRWVSPGDTLVLRIRAIDSSGHYSRAWIDTIAVSKGVLWQNKCPPNFAPVKMDDSVFCMEKLQHASNGKFEQNILYIDAKKSCENLGFNLCTEQQWNAACNSGGSGYGIIEEKNEYGIFSPSEFLFMYCGVGTGDSASANNVSRRNKICTNPNSIRDLPGQLQEWVVGKGDSGDVALLKGSSYAIFEGASRVELAQCRNRYTPTRIRPRYTTDSVYLYRSGSRIDTLLTRDTLRTIYAALPPSSFTDTLLVYTLKSLNGNLLGIDYVNQVEYRKRGGEEWLKVLWQGLSYEPKEEWRVLILGTENIDASNFFLDPTVGFRCCTAFSNLSP